MKSVKQMTIKSLENEMINHFKNMVELKQNASNISITENEHFFELFAEWVFKQHHIDSSNLTINFKLDKEINKAKAINTKLNNNYYNIAISRCYSKSANPIIFGKSLILSGHEIEHIMQSLITPSWEQSLVRQRIGFDNALINYSNKNNKKKAKKLINRLKENAEINHFSQLDADKKAHMYALKLIERLSDKVVENSGLDDFIDIANDNVKVDLNKEQMQYLAVYKFMQSVKLSINNENVHNVQESNKVNKQIKKDINITKRIGLNVFAL